MTTTTDTTSSDRTETVQAVARTVWGARIDGKIIGPTTEAVAREAVADWQAEGDEDAAILTRTEYTVEPTEWVEA